MNIHKRVFEFQEWFPNVRLSPAVEFKEDKPDKSPPETQDEQDVRFTRTFSIESEEGAVTSMKMENITITRRVSLVPMVILLLYYITLTDLLSYDSNETKFGLCSL